MPLWAFLLGAGVLGAVVGSFLNVCVYRLPLGQSVVRPRSRCPACAQPIAWHDNVPVLSWVALRGRCRRCRAPISLRYPLVELGTALIWVAAAARYGLSPEALRTAVFLTLLLGIALTDAMHMVIPDHFSVVGTGIGLAMAPLAGGIGLVAALAGALGSYVLLWALKLAFERAVRKPALGVGDIHLMAMVGAFAGPGGSLLAVLFGSLLGVVIGVPITLRHERFKLLGSYLPLGTFLAIGAAVAYVWGGALLDWYFGLALGGT